MKKLVNGVLGAFLVIALSSTPLYGIKSTISKVESPIEHVVKEISLLDQIMEQAKFIVGFEDQQSLSQAKKRLISLMNSKELDVKIKDVIKDDIEIIKKTTEVSRKASQEAYDRLVIIVKQIEVQVNIVAAIEEGAILVKNAPVDEKQDAIKAAQKKVQEAEQEQGMLWRLYAGAKRMITAPVNYVFGEESSKAKTAFYATVGAAVLAAGAYGASQYGVAPEERKKSVLLSEKGDNKSEIEEVKQGITKTLPAGSLPSEKSVEDERIKQEQLKGVINYDTVLAEIQRKYLKSPDPEDRELLYSYEQDIKEKSGISWEEIYESRNKVRQEEGIGKNFELAILAEIQRKYLSKELKEDDQEIRAHLTYQLHQIVSHMFDTLSVKEINALGDRVLKEIVKGVHFENITYQLVSDEFNNFIQKFAPPLNIQETIDAHKDINYGLLRGKDESSNVYAKGVEVSRLFNAERMRECIERNNFTTLAVAKKWIYKVNGEWRVYAEYIKRKKGKILTLKETQDLVGLTEQTGFVDWVDNLIVDERNGKPTFIDTENISFLPRGGEDFPLNSRVQRVHGLYHYWNAMDEDAQRWFENHIDYLKNNAEGTIQNDPLPWSGQFDDPNFDFEKMKAELEADTNVIKY